MKLSRGSRRIPVRAWCLLHAVLLQLALVAAIASAERLARHPANPRYFTDGSGKAVYLTGSHTWDNFHDLAPGGFDYEGYLAFLGRYNHNFIRMWSGSELVNAKPPIYERTDPGLALDGGPRADLTRFNQAYFDRLRLRVIAARDRGIYVSVMLFRGDNVLNEGRNKNWPKHHFNAANNINGINGDPDGDNVGLEAHTLQIPAVVALQEAYVRKVIDTLNDLDNVLYEISNEEVGAPRNPRNIAWQYYWINYIKDYEKSQKAKQHPTMMTTQWPAEGANGVLFASPADAVSPLRGLYDESPRPADGSKIIIADVDHIWPKAPQREWIWKSFLRGLHPILMDWYGWGEPGWISLEEQEAMRRNMGYTLTYASKMNLAAMRPRGDLASSGYCLADPGNAYLAYLPSKRSWIGSISLLNAVLTNAVSVDLSAASGPFDVEWFNPATGAIIPGRPTTGGTKKSFTPPFSGDAVLYLRSSAGALSR